jgi:hypothetical protein
MIILESSKMHKHVIQIKNSTKIICLLTHILRNHLSTPHTFLVICYNVIKHNTLFCKERKVGFATIFIKGMLQKRNTENNNKLSAVKKEKYPIPNDHSSIRH